MSLRKAGLALLAVCASLLIVPVAAGATTVRATSASPLAVTSLDSVPINGKAVKNKNKSFTGHFDVNYFATRAGKTYAIGTLTGKFGNKKISRSGVAIPASVTQAATSSKASTRQATTPCQVLHLVLGPVNLNLLGLQVTLGGGPQANQPIVLDITAMGGNGNLLGNLVYDVAGLLNNSPAAGLVTGLLNLLNTVLSNPALGTV